MEGSGVKFRKIDLDGSETAGSIVSRKVARQSIVQFFERLPEISEGPAAHNDLRLGSLYHILFPKQA